jgi:hypothetical protein
MDIEKKRSSKKLSSILISLATLAIFVGPRVFYQVRQESGISSAKTLDAIEAVKRKIGDEAFDNVMKGMLPVGYVAMCVKKNGENTELVAAAKAYNKRNEAKMVAVFEALQNRGGLTAAEKEAVDKFAYARVAGDINNDYISCDSLGDRLNRGEWDY